MPILRLFLFATFILAIATVSYASEIDHDSRALTDEEQTTFLPLVCLNPVTRDGTQYCSPIMNYPGHQGEDGSLSLDAVVYGDFTRRGADETYLSYSSSFEPHAHNFGGGVLLERSGHDWKLVRWYPDGQMDNCLAIPGSGPRTMLCLSYWRGAGAADSSVWAKHVAPTNDPETMWNAATSVLKAQDDRVAIIGSGGCDNKQRRDEGILLSINNLVHSLDPTYFAQSDITYATPNDVAEACKHSDFPHVKTTKGVVHYAVTNGEVKAVTPIGFSPTDY